MKRTYSDDKSVEIATRDHPTYYQLTKEQGLTGEDFRYAAKTGNPQSISGTFATAQGQADGNSGKLYGEQFAATPRIKYGILKLDRPSMLKAQLSGRGAFYDFVTSHTEGMLEELGARLSFDLFGDGNGVRGQIATAGIAGNVLTLAAARTADRFKRGMVIGASTGSDGSTGARVGTTFVTKVDRANNKITVNNAGAIAALAAGDYLFAAGEPGTCIEGMGLCTPLVAPTSGVLFRTVERTNDLEALAGSRQNNSAIYPEEVIGDLAVDVYTLNKKLTRGVVHPVKFQEIVKRLGAKVTYTSPGGSADIGFESITIHAAGAMLQLGSDPDCPFTTVRGWNARSHVLKYLGPKPVHWIRTDSGGMAQWSTTSDGFEYRACSYGNYLQPDPSEHAVGSVAE
ncbi:MAG TPA: hypothetical protein VLT45_07795 [Kofleriaceae bacterium]|nr:hypothetical protein [Kofleriaceae bacterium]